MDKSAKIEDQLLNVPTEPQSGYALCPHLYGLVSDVGDLNLRLSATSNDLERK
jgi:hypothetical protein